MSPIKIIGSMAKITINELLDSVPMGGVITAYAPIDEVIRCASERNSALRGEWFDVTCAIDQAGRVIAVIARRELWNIADADNLLASQRMWRRRVQEWRV